MKKILTILYLCFHVLLVHAEPIDESTALKTAEKFYLLNSPSGLKSGSLLTLAYKCTSKQTSANKSASLIAYYYVFNSGSNGFVIVAGDDASHPILGYSMEGSYDANNVPPTVKKWMEGYKKQLQYIIENNLKADETIQSEWNSISNGLPILKSFKSGVLPLIKSKWNQAPFVNERCPYDNIAKDRTVTGCPATAMAQIMKYWKYPKIGLGFHSYKDPNYGTLSANFSTTTYDWDKMPDVVNSANDAVATLMYHCGVAVEMDYGIEGSSSYVIMDGYPKEQTVEYALKTYFGYSTTLQGIRRSNFTDINWKTKLKTELDASRPIQYAGFGGKGGHTFVCDGYDSNDFFHMNWGWGGTYDAYFNLNALNPGPGGTGAGAGKYNDGQQALIGIKPPDTGQSFKMEIYKDVASDKPTFEYADNFTISTDLFNNGQSTFNGEFCAAAFNESGGFVDYIETKSNISLGAGYHYANGIKFSTQGLLTLLPGKYNIYIFYKPTGGNWAAIKSAASDLITKDYTTITITNKNDLCLYASLVLTPKAPIYKGDPFSVWLDVANYSTKKFTGTIEIDVYSLEGDSITTIEAKPGLSLSANSHYQSGLTFSTKNLDVPAGSYLLVVFHKWDGSVWELTGSTRLTGTSTTSYINPVIIVVQDKPLPPDIYEPNDQPSKAYDLTSSFSGNSVIKKTTGSNIHSGTDIDYYKFTLSSGYDYKINARLQDEYSNNDGKYYSLDCSFAYSFDGINWSDSFDDLMTSDISISGAKTLYFEISPYFEGAKGTYQFDLSITRSSATFAALSTTAITSITSTSASSGGNISSSGGSSVTARGVCWSTSAAPTTANNKTSDGTGTGIFSSSLTNLSAGTTYYVRAYATNSLGTVYGNEISFTTSATLATLTTTAISAITATTASSGGNISSSGGSSVTARGVCWSTSAAPTTANNKTSDGTGTGIFSSSLTNLSAGTTYYVRAYAISGAGTAYGNELTFSSLVTAVSEYEINEEGINVYPNPASEFTNIDLLNYKHNIKEVSITDIAGRVLFKDSSNDLKLIRISTANFKSGTFLVRITDKSGVTITRKLIVIK